MLSGKNTCAIVYHYYERDETYRDNFVFFLARAWRADLDFFLIISGGCSVELPQRKNLNYIFSENFGQDFGGFALVAETGVLDKYDRLIFANCSVRGPLLPPYVQSCWTKPYLALLTEGVHLAGSTINILHSTRPFHDLYKEQFPEDPEPYSHVQSSVHAMTRQCFALLRHKGFYAKAQEMTKEMAVVKCEIALSQIVRANGWNISCLLPPYNALDYRSSHQDINPTTESGHPQLKDSYFGQTLHPYEVLFVKTGWKTISAKSIDFYSLMALRFHPLKGLRWPEARALRDRLLARNADWGAPLIDLVQQPAAATVAKPADSRATPRRSCLMVLGMHRSGTSALAGSLVRLGAASPKTLMEAHESNSKGFYESNAIRDFNDSLLVSCGSDWKDWRPISRTWFASDEARSRRADAVEMIDQEFGDAPLLMMKDPRICRLLPFWKDVLDEMEIGMLALHTHRHPTEVAASLATRYNLEEQLTHLIWLQHQLAAEVASRGMRRLFCSYDQLIEDAPQLARRIVNGFDLKLSSAADFETLNEFISGDLRHHHRPADSTGEMSIWVEQTLEVFDQWACDGENACDRINLDHIRQEFARAIQGLSAMLATGKPIKQQR